MPNPQGSFIWYELITPDPDGARAFYPAVVGGWSIDATSETMPNGAEYRMIRRSDGKEEGGLMKLSSDMQEHGARPMWAGYINVDDVDRTIVAIQGDGGQVYMPAMDIGGVGRIAMVSDPSGAAFYIMTPTPPPGREDEPSDVFSVDQPQHVRWNELWSGDPAQAVDFYTRQFGWVQDGDMDMGALGKYQFLNHGGVMIGAIMPLMPDMPASMWNFYFGVEDIDVAAAAVKSNGGQLFQDPMQIPGGEYAVNGSDPQGALFGLVGPRKA